MLKNLNKNKQILKIAEPSSLIIFGITGDLSRKKLIPAIYDLANKDLLSKNFGLVGFGRRKYSKQDFIFFLKDSIKKYARTEWNENTWGKLIKGVRYVCGNFNDDSSFIDLKKTLYELDKNQKTRENYAFYLSLSPSFFKPVCEKLYQHNLTKTNSLSWRRLIVEKPFGHNLDSAKKLNKIIEKAFFRNDIFRIDHYLGKETVQNILALRFANQIFEPLWNNKFIDHVQITMAEDIGIEGRGGYYDGVGAARDIIQNHLLQLLALIAMEKPQDLSVESLRTEKEKILSSVILPNDLDKYTSRGQYVKGYQNNKMVTGFLNEDGVNKNSTTETFAAICLNINTERWINIPFYLRTGKRLAKKVTEIALIMKKNPDDLFENLDNNSIIIDIQPNDGISINFGSKVPNFNDDIKNVSMNFVYDNEFSEEPNPTAHERLIFDVLTGRSLLFPSHKEIELSWMILDPIEKHWSKIKYIENYKPETWGPSSSNNMLMKDKRSWRNGV